MNGFQTVPHYQLDSYGNPLKKERKERRTKAEMSEIREAIIATVATDHPMTLRQLFYRLVSDGVVAKTEAEYKGTVGRLLTNLRLDGTIPLGWIADNTRWVRRVETFDDVQDALNTTARTYHRNIWNDQEDHVEIWLEKDALAGVFTEETNRYQVPLMVTRGYPSRTYLYDAAANLADLDKPAYLYYFGDSDPAGEDIPRNVEAFLHDNAEDAEIHFEHVAVKPEQIDRWNLPTRPTKDNDHRGRKWKDAGKGNSVEVDAIPANQLRKLVRECITQHVNPIDLALTQQQEQEDRAYLWELAAA